MRNVWNTTFWTSSKTIDVHLGWVRRKLGDDSRRPTLITTIRGKGLRFETGSEVVEAGLASLLRVAPAADPHHAPTLAVIGGGQLARMMAQPAIALGLPLRLLAEAEGVSAAQVIPDHVVGDYRDLDTLRAVTAGCSVVTFDHEHVPTEHLHALEDDGLAVRPGPGALVHAQDKARDAGAARRARRCPRRGTRSWPRSRTSRRSASRASSRPPAAGTTARASGSSPVPRSAPSRSAWPPETGVRLLAEEVVDFRRELSALVARAPSGQAAAYPVVASTQVDGICVEVVAPAPDLDPDLAGRAQEIALTIAGALDVTGVLAVELFETTDGRVLVNELAMRPHNTGHWTQDGAVTSQFENHLRAVLDLPLGSPSLRSPLDGDGEHPRRARRHRPAVRRVPARAGPRPAPAGAPLRQGPAAGPQGRARERLR